MATNQNTRIVTNETLAEVIKPAHVRKLMRFSRATGYSISPILNRAVENWLSIEAPVYLAHAKKVRGQKA
jgi:hypothetical protein